MGQNCTLKIERSKIREVCLKLRPLLKIQNVEMLINQISLKLILTILC